MKLANSTASKPVRRRPPRKVTYSLPDDLLEKLDRASGTARAKSGIVAEALTQYFAEREKRQLEAEFEGAAADPAFVDDNQAVLRDFAALDAEIERGKR
jgi:predicted transcriptional regulator